MDSRSSSREHPISQSTSLQIRHGTKALITTSERVLLVREQHSDNSSFWTLPGGGMESCESLSACLAREVFEELHCQVMIDRPVGTIWYAHSSCQNTFSVYTVFSCYLLSSPVSNEKEGIIEYQWVSPTDLPSSTLPQVHHVLRKI